MKRTRLAVALAALDVLAVSGVVNASGAHRTPRAVYVALGDVWTQGAGLDHPETQSYPALLARHLPRGSRVLNLGSSIDTKIANALTEELPQALRAHPTLVTVFLNWADARYGTPVAAYRARLTRLLAALRHAHAHVFVGNVADPRVKWDPTIYNFDPKATVARRYNTVIASVATQYGATVVDIFSMTKSLWGHPQNVDPNNSDGLPNIKGQAILAQMFYRVMHRRGVL